MHPDLDVQRRVLIKSYRLYLEADRSWNAAIREAKTWFPVGRRPAEPLLGDPGSRLRRLYDARERALQRLIVSRDKLEQARQRLVQKDRMSRPQTWILLLSV